MNTKRIPIKHQRHCAFIFPTIKQLNARLDYTRKLSAKTFLQKRSSNPFQSFHHLLRNQKLLSQLLLDLDWKRGYITSKDFNLFASLTRKLPSLKSLSLKFTSYGSGLLSTKLLRLYKCFFKQCKSLTALELDFATTEIYQDDIYYICQGVKSLKSLHTLKINLSSCLGVTDKAIRFIKGLLQRATNLKCLVLNLASSPSFSKRRFYELGKVSLPKLESFDLNIIRNSDPYSIRTSSRIITSSTTLQKICLRLSRARLDYVEKVLLRHANTLKTVQIKASSLEMNYEETNTNGIAEKKNPFAFLLKLRELKNLQLDFSNAKAEASIVVSLWNVLAKLNTLKYLDINLLLCEGVDEKSIKLINEALASATGLKDFSLVIGTNSAEGRKRINDKFFSGLHEGLKKLQDLRRFSFECWYADTLTDNSLALFEQMLSKHQNLSELHLGFPKCLKITDKGLKPISEIIKQGKALEKVSLNFEDCEKVKGSTTATLCEVVAGKQIDVLKINFNKTQLEDEGMHNLLNMVKYLKEYAVSVERCTNLREIALDKSIKLLPKLFKIDFNFLYCNELSAKDLKTLSKDIEIKAVSLKEFNFNRER